MIEFACEVCAHVYRVADEMSGKRAKCRECGNVLQVPEIDVMDVDAVPLPIDAGRARAAGHATGSHREVAPVVRGTSPHFGYEISQRPDFSLVTIHLQPGQKVFAEPSAMAAMTPSIRLQTGFKGGLGKTIGRALGGESLLINTFAAEDAAGEVTFAAGAVGDTTYYRLTGNSLFLQRGAFMLHSEGVELTAKWQGARGFFSGEGLVLLKATGVGDLFFTSYGAILEIDVTDEYFVDTGYVVAFEDSLDYRVTVLPGLRAGGQIKSFFFGGEGLVCQFSGQGRLWVQTRHVQSFLTWVFPYRRTRSR